MVVFSFWSLYPCFNIVQNLLGTPIAIISLFFAPFLIGLAPFYAGFALGHWLPLIVTYGGLAVCSILYWLGLLIAGDD